MPEHKALRGIYFTPSELAGWMISAAQEIAKREFSEREYVLLDPAVGEGIFAQIAGPSIACWGKEILAENLAKAQVNCPWAKLEEGDGLSWRPEIGNKIPVVIGNPPYRGHSANPGFRANAYFQSQGKPLKERNSKWLNDDYVKFIRWGEELILKHNQGLMCLVTNHGYLSNPTFKGMRESLNQSFNLIYLFDLHGGGRKRESTPEGKKDENIFPILTGVAVGIFIRKPELKESRIFHGEIWGNREEKLAWLKENSFSQVGWQEITPKGPEYFFIRTDSTRQTEYDKGVSLKALMPFNALGFQTHRDHFAISFSEQDMRQRLNDLKSDFSDREIREKYKLKDTRDWQLNKAREVLKQSPDIPIIRALYRPFDWRYCALATMDFPRPALANVLIDRPRSELLPHLMQKRNYALLVSRQQAKPGFSHIFVADCPAESCVLSTQSREGNQVFPVYLKDKGLNLGDVPYKSEEFIHYIYAVLHAPWYRERYAEFLCRDFPKIPLPNKHMEELAFWGKELIDLHLMAKIAPLKDEKIPEFKVGIFKPAEKWQKERKNREISAEELAFQRQIIANSQASLEIMHKLERLYP